MTQILHDESGESRLHNRLAHSLKVAQVASSIALQLGEPVEIDPNVCEAAALAHDLGHPPFGHVGEQVLDELVRARGGEGYEGNAQAFRVVTKLASHNPVDPGLDLTRATLDAILKYPWPYEAAGEGHPALYSTESEDFTFVHSGGVGDAGIEASIVDWSDDITYALHDLDDFYRAGIFGIRDLLSYNVEALFDAARERVQGPSRPRLREGEWSVAFENIRRYFMRPYNAPILRPFDCTQTQEGLLSVSTSYWLTRWLDSIELIDNQVTIAAESWHEISLIKEFVYQTVVANRTATGYLQRQDRRILTEVFERTEEALDREPWPRLPGSLRFMLSIGESGPAGDVRGAKAVAVRAIADYISQMTETEVRHEHSR